MRARSWIRAIAGGVCVAIVGALMVAAPAVAAAAPTVRTVVRPVTSSGHAAPGYTVTTPAGAPTVLCNTSVPSPSAVDGDIVLCGPDAAYAVACWWAATPHHVLCLQNSIANKLVRYHVHGVVAQTRPLHTRAPLNLRLGDGTYCELRDGGAASSLRGHPHYAVFYYCTHGLAIWAPLQSNNFGVNRAQSTWTVRIAPADGKGSLSLHKVAHVWFVGTRAA